MPSERAVNFGAGPSALPKEVLEEAAASLLNWNDTGIGIAEISHRSKEFVAFIETLESQIRTQLDVPTTHSILFTQGGGTGQFSAVVYNMLARHHLLFPNVPPGSRSLDYVVTGSWSKKAADEARRLGGVVNTVADARLFSADKKTFDSIPPAESYKFSDNPALIYYCDNETVDGVQFSDDLSSPSSFPFHLLPKDTLIPLVGDHSSSFLSRPIPRLSDHAIVFAGAQKNVGPAGLTILIVRKDCIVDVDAAVQIGALPTPITFSYKTLAESKSLYNTPSVISVYISGLVLLRSQKLGGVQYYAAVNKRKAGKVYQVIREGEEKGIFKARVREGSQSLMNATFTILGEGREADFISGAEAKGLKALKGHRSVGGKFYRHLYTQAHAIIGIRVSLYNAITEEETDRLVEYMKDFLQSA